MTTLSQTNQALKACCATVYESDFAKFLLGDSFHPGGLALTQRLGKLLNLQPGQRVLDVAAGQGASAIFLAQQFDCRVVGLDFGVNTVAEATGRAQQAGLAGQVYFEPGDAESLQFDDATFDAVICECAFCTFPNKPAAAHEFARVLRPGGQVGLSDLTRDGSLPDTLDGLLAWIACIADARSVGDYIQFLEQGGLAVRQIEAHNNVLAKMVRNIQAKLLGAELMVKLNKLDLPGTGVANLDQARIMARSAAEAVRAGKLGYALITAIAEN